MAEVGSPGGGWPVWNGTGSEGLVIGESNGTAFGTVNYTVCGFWDGIEAQRVAGNATASSTSSASGTGSGATATGTATATATPTGEGTVLQIAFQWLLSLL